MMPYTVRTFAERPDLIDENWRLVDEGWAEFMKHDLVGDRYFGRLYEAFPGFQFMLCDGETMVATCNSIPVIWNLNNVTLPDAGWDWALESGFGLLESGRMPTTLSALSITIARSYLGRGISSHVLRVMKDLAAQHRFNALIAPVRPTLKARYPLMPMERYVAWRQQPDTDAPFDPWLRAHWRVGARIVKVAPRSMIISGTFAEWEGWTGLKFPESGEYVIEGALNPVTADQPNDRITYVEPNVWMHHPIP